jgi:CHAT domain-containing protein
MSKLSLLVTSFLFLLGLLFFYQKQNKILAWDELIKLNKADLALDQIKKETDELQEKGLLDSLSYYLEVYGRILEASSPSEDANELLLKIYQKWESSMNSPKPKRKLAQSLSDWYKYAGKNGEAFEKLSEALEWAKKEEVKDKQLLAKLYMNLGGLAVNTMNLPEAKGFLKEALSIYGKELDAESIYLANNYLGNIAYFGSKLDSAAFFFQKAILAIDQLPKTPKNQFYRKSLISNNLAGVQIAQGEYQQAEKAMTETIINLEKYLETELDPAQNKDVLIFYFQATDNLAGFYKEQGAFRRAGQLLQYSFQRKVEEFGSQDIETAKSRIFLGQLYFEMHRIADARSNLNEGIKIIGASKEELTYYQADAIYALARLEDFEGKESLADSLYLEAKSLFEKSLQGEFDVIFLGFLNNYSKFLAENQRLAEAVKISQMAGKYLSQIESNNLRLEFGQILNLALIYESGSKYRESLNYANRSLKLIKQLIEKSNFPGDSLQAVFQYPVAILIKSRIRYAITDVKDISFLQGLESDLRKGLEIIDSKSDFLTETLDINIFLNVNKEYTDFLKKIELELYELSQDQIYLDRLLAYHEYSIYRTIRTRLQKTHGLNYGGVPSKIVIREQTLKKQLKNSLKVEAKSLEEYRKASEEWESFMDTLSLSYPNYYQVHFESSENTLERIYSQLNHELTYLRYIQFGDEWKLLLINGSEKKLISLKSSEINKGLLQLEKETASRNFSKNLLYSLFLQLWKPAEKDIRGERVVIIPDGPLFNLSFETLTFVKIQEWEQLATSSLLAKHSISYQYGLLLLDPTKKNDYRGQMIAFAPGFFDQMKQSYLESVKDEEKMDRAYLQLIPQPFTKQLVNQMKAQFGAKTFLENFSTIQNFKEWAGNHQVIHIGTHAFSDNVNPGDSRLVFAKSSVDLSDANELYSSEIYNLNLEAELAVLLACESGKPTYAPGEGMVSLAHAFNYSGTKSLLMGLWKIDEKASTTITASFYGFLSQGLSKDEALRMAKLEFLSHAKGRELEPSFWAGLILLGDPNPLKLKTNSSIWIWIFTFGCFSVLFFLVRKYFMKS